VLVVEDALTVDPPQTSGSADSYEGAHTYVREIAVKDVDDGTAGITAQSASEMVAFA
jgi:hypothetical protein